LLYYVFKFRQCLLKLAQIGFFLAHTTPGKSVRKGTLAGYYGQSESTSEKLNR